MSFATIEDLRSQLGAKGPTKSPAYVEKMMHALPSASSVDRAAFILERVQGKYVLEFGASGPLHTAIQQAAAMTMGVDRTASDGVVAFDLDDVSQCHLPEFTADIIVCGEVLEHLGNPQWFLTRLHRQYGGVPVLITVPNAFSRVARAHLAHGVENVNKDHVCWYSWRTLTTLLERAGYAITEFHYYGGDGPTAQGLVVLAE